MKSTSWIRTLYLYTFSLLGLVLVIIGGVRFIDMGLKAFVFTSADGEEKIYREQPPFPARLPDDSRDMLFEVDKDGQILPEVKKEGVFVTLPSEDYVLVQEWLGDYRVWQERQKAFDPVVARRQRDAASSIAMIVVGIPLFLYHWRVIRRESV
jgi:hypothetical protein